MWELKNMTSGVRNGKNMVVIPSNFLTKMFSK